MLSRNLSACLCAVSGLALIVGGAPGALALPLTEGGTQDTDDFGTSDLDELPDGPQDVITVTGKRQRGMVIGNIEPELTLDATDIDGYGVSSLAELLDELSAETSSGRGRTNGPPVVLLNGRRISGFREIGQYPPETLERVEVLAEEVALKYGYRADQRVINFVLKSNVKIITVEGEAEAPLAGGTTETEGSVRRVWVDGNRRWSLNGEITTQSPLHESERSLEGDVLALPYASDGNVGALSFGDEIDPALSGLVGSVVTVTPFPQVASVPSLADFTTGAEVASVTDQGSFRTLRPETEEISLGLSYSWEVLDEATATLSGQIDQTERLSEQGVGATLFTLPSGNAFSPFAADVGLYQYQAGLGPLSSTTDSLVGNMGLGLISKPGQWNWALTASANINETDSVRALAVDTDAAQALLDANDSAFNPFTNAADALSLTQQYSTTETTTGEAELVVNGDLAELPAGQMTTALKAGFQTLDQSSTVRFEDGVTVADLSRDQINLQANVDVPLTSEDDDRWAWVGSLTANANVALDELSDFGTLSTIGYGVSWQPADPVRVTLSVTKEEGAPSVAQLANPVLETANGRVFDYTTGETVLVTAISGGNPDLLADNRTVFKAGLNLKPWEETDLRFSLDYTASEIEDESRSFPTLTAEIEAAFADRIVRDVDGNLLSIDQRPINFEETTKRQLRTGLTYSKRLGRQSRGGPPNGRPNGRPSGRPSAGPSGQPPAQRPAAAGASAGGRPQGAASPSGEQARPTAGRPQAARPSRPRGRPGRMRVSLFHNWVLEDSLRIRDGVADLDLLNGSALTENGGQPEHEVTLSGFAFNKGLGMRGRLKWQSGTEVNNGTFGDLAFSDLVTWNMRFFMDLEQRGMATKYPWLKGTRISLDFENILDDRIDVRDESGLVPTSYQPDLLDPIGRSIGFEVRKRF